MAKYLYKCLEDNEHITEHEYGMLENRPEILPCSICGADSKRTFDIPRVHYKGEGFYSTNKVDRKKPVVDDTSI